MNTANENELVYLCQSQDQEAFRLLSDRFRGIERFLYRTKLAYLEDFYARDDWYADCDRELQKTLLRYRSDCGCTFHTFFENVIRTMTKNVIRSHQRHGQDISLEGLSSQLQEDHEGTDLHSSGLLRDERAESEESILWRERCKIILKTIYKSFSEDDLRIVSLLASGKSRNQIHREYDIPIRRIRNISEKCRAIRDEIDRS